MDKGRAAPHLEVDRNLSQYAKDLQAKESIQQKECSLLVGDREVARADHLVEVEMDPTSIPIMTIFMAPGRIQDKALASRRREPLRRTSRTD